jgi:hypothetical protein
MFRRFLFLGVGALALLVALAAPGQVHAQRLRGGAQDGLYGADSEAASDGKNLSLVLTAAGVPNNGGRLQWPLGLRLVGGTEGDELRQQIEALFQYGAEQTRTGPVSPHLRQELARSVGALRKLLLSDKEERFSLPLTSYEESERFLAKLDHARKLLEPDPEPSKGKVPRSSP